MKRKMVGIINKLIPITGLEPTFGEVRRDRLSGAILNSFVYRRKSAAKTKNVYRLKSAAKTKNIKCKDIEKLQTIVDYNNNLFHYDDAAEYINLCLYIHDLTNGEIRQWKAIWKGVEGELEGKGRFYEKAAWCRNTLYNKHLDALDALEANARLGNKKTGQTGLKLELQWYLANELDSFIKDCNRYLLNKALVYLEIVYNHPLSPSMSHTSHGLVDQIIIGLIPPFVLGDNQG
jgi:hypothetical protein